VTFSRPRILGFSSHSSHVHTLRTLVSQNANWISFRAVVEHFLAKDMGGQSEPYGADLGGATLMKVVTGEKSVHGLAEALAARSKS
jgi:hypothetical protein